MTVTEEIGEMLKSLTEPKGETNDSTDSTDKQEVVHQESDRRSDISGGSDLGGSGGSDLSTTSQTSGQEGDKTLHTTETETVVGSDTSGDIETKEVPESKPDERDQTIADLRAKLAEKESRPKEPEKKEEPKSDSQDFVGEEDFDELTRDPKRLNEVFNKVYQKAVLDTRQSVIKELPNIVKDNIVLMNNLKQASDEFYEENADLKSFKKVVATVFEEMAEKTPDKSYSDIMKAVAPEVRNRLELTKKEETNGKSTKTESPKLPTKGTKAGSSQSKPTVDPLQAELEEMNRTLGRI